MEDKLANLLFGAEAARLRALAEEVMLEQGVAEGDLANGRIAVPMPLADEAFVHAGKLLPTIVEARFAHRVVCEIDGPAVQCGRALARPQVVAVEHLRVPYDVEHDGVAVVVGVHGVKYEARFHVKPANVGIAAIAWHHTNAGRMLRIPRVRERVVVDL